jgi:hypothetical protein
MILCVRFRPELPPGHALHVDFEPSEDISGEQLEIDLGTMFTARCGGRAWHLTAACGEDIRRRFFPSVPAGQRMFVCEHAIEIGD